MPMRKVHVSNIKEELSVIGLGCMSFSAFFPGHPQPPVEQSLQVIEEALKEGINVFNTAEFYGLDGHNELILGQAIKKFGREKFFIVSKFGLVRNPQGGIGGFDGSAANTRKSLEKTLQRLGTDYVDCYMPARIDPNVPVEETIAELAKLKQEGKVHYLGLSEAAGPTIRRANKVHQISLLESEYSLWSLHLEEDVIPTIRELGIGLLAYSPIGRGFLSGELKKYEDLAPTDFRRHTPRFMPENFNDNLVLVQEVEKLAKKKGVTNAQLALAWLLYKGTDIIPIPGTSNPTRIHENAGAANVTLTKDDVVEIDAILAKFPVKGHRYPEALQHMLHK